MLLPVLVLLISVLLTVGWMTPAHGEETTSDQSSKGISIEYDSPSTIHKVGNVILFCMNNEMHWPHDTDTFKAPLYEEGYLTRENFQEKTGKTDTDYDTFIQELSVLLYAGYPYNGLGLFPIEGNGGSGSISEDAFRQLLIPSERLRSDFPELSKTEAGKPVEDQATLKAFMNAVFNNYYNTSEVTASGMKYSDITETAFYKAAFCVVNSADPREAYTRIYLNESPYESTSNAIWQLMKDYGIPNNNKMSLSDKSKELLEAAKSDNVSILSAEPTSEQTSRVQIVGDTTFSQSKEDGKWYTGELHVAEPANFHGAYTITLPEGTSLYEGSTLVKAGELFQLVSEKKPEGKKTVTVSATIPWLKSVKMYSPVKNGDQEVTASDGNSFQHMVGAEIGTADVGASADLTVPAEDPNQPSTTDPSNPVNPSNPSTPTDPSTPVTPPNPVNPNGPSIPPNQENTSASEEPSSPEHTVSRETPAANQPAASKKPTAVKKSDGNGKQKVSASVLPKTGDSSHVMLWGLGLIGCGAAALGLLTLRIRNRREE